VKGGRPPTPADARDFMRKMFEYGGRWFSFDEGQYVPGQISPQALVHAQDVRIRRAVVQLR
jgi:hypothetical protein